MTSNLDSPACCKPLQLKGLQKSACFKCFLLRAKDHDIKCILNASLNAVKILSLQAWRVHEFLYMHMYHEFIGHIHKTELTNTYESRN